MIRSRAIHLGVGMGLLLGAYTSEAAPLTVLWSPATGATSYRVEQSVDGGMTWTTIATVATDVCGDGTCDAAVVAPDTGRTLFRVVALNAAGAVVLDRLRTEYCGSCPVLPLWPSDATVRISQ